SHPEWGARNPRHPFRVRSLASKTTPGVRKQRVRLANIPARSGVHYAAERPSILLSAHNTNTQQLGIEVRVGSFLDLIWRHVADEPAEIANTLNALTAVNRSRVFKNQACVRLQANLMLPDGIRDRLLHFISGDSIFPEAIDFSLQRLFHL